MKIIPITLTATSSTADGAAASLTRLWDALEAGQSGGEIPDDYSGERSWIATYFERIGRAGRSYTIARANYPSGVEAGVAFMYVASMRVDLDFVTGPQGSKAAALID